VKNLRIVSSDGKVLFENPGPFSPEEVARLTREVMATSERRVYEEGSNS